jgi:hypothetical protein
LSQSLPQNPQLRGSVCVLVQEKRSVPGPPCAMHEVSPWAHWATQVPFEQRLVWPEHWVPQAPQLFGLFCWLTQLGVPPWPGHEEKSGRQVQAPSRQYWVAEQSLPQLPQCSGLSLRSRHAVPPPKEAQASRLASQPH